MISPSPSKILHSSSTRAVFFLGSCDDDDDDDDDDNDDDDGIKISNSNNSYQVNDNEESRNTALSFNHL